MEKIVINGGTPLKGSVEISGAKNAVVAILPATLLAQDVCRIENIPDISDVTIMLKILAQLGASVKMINRTTYEIDTRNVNSYIVPNEHTKHLRASYYLLGALLGYVYARTRDVKYTILLHMIINFMGSIVALPIEKAMYTFYELYDLLLAGESVNILALMANGAILLIYENLQYGMLIGGIYALVNMWKKKKILVNRDKEIFLPDSEIVKGGILNVGSILFILLCAVFMFLNIFFT